MYRSNIESRLERKDVLCSPLCNTGVKYWTLSVLNLLANVCVSGAIELLVFSEHYLTELDVVDIQTQRIDRFGNFITFMSTMSNPNPNPNPNPYHNHLILY